MLIQFVMVGLGGALGSMLRYLISLIPVNNTFPFLTLITNLLGALLIGFIVGLSDNLFISKKFLLFLKTGVCGGFTTFSTFSLEAVQLFQRGEPFLGTIYAILSVILCLLVSFSENILGGSLFKQQNYIVSP